MVPSDIPPGLQHFPRAEIEQGAGGRGADHAGNETLRIGKAQDVHGQAGQVVGGFGETAHLGALAPEHFHRAHGRYPFFHGVVQRGIRPARGDIALADARAEIAEVEHVKRDGGEDEQRQVPVEFQQQRRADEHEHDVVAKIHRHAAHTGLNRRHVIEHHAQQAAGLHVVEEGERQRGELIVQRLAQFEHHALPDQGNIIVVLPGGKHSPVV